MLTVPPWIDSPGRDADPAPRPRRDTHLALLRWPIALLLLLALLGAWRTGGDEPGARVAGPTPAPSTGASTRRSVGPARLQLPRSWREVERTGARATWEAPDGVHAVTLAHAEAAAVPLIAVVRQVARDAGTSVAGARVVEGPTLVEPEVAMPRDDSVVLLRLRVDRGGGDLLDVVQAWRRDSRAGFDVVATWTSGDGSWPVDPRTTIADTTGS